MKEKIGLIAIGSREDRREWNDLIEQLEPELDVQMVGVLDDLTEEEITERFSFEPGDDYIVTSMPWGTTVHVSEEKVRDEVYRLANEAFDTGIRTVMVLCTGDLVRVDHENGLFILPEDMIAGLLQGLNQKRIGFIVPEPDQIRSSYKQYSSFDPVIKAASPYEPMDKLAIVADEFKTENVKLIVADCMGFTAKMGKIIAEHSGKQVLVPRLVLPKIVKALLSQK